jgi:Raf kinase inhibitor-like YbhB/YbcL family protein
MEVRMRTAHFLCATILAWAASAAGALTLTSPAFQRDQFLPIRYTSDGKDASPPLAWSGAPNGTKQFALIVEDPDAPGGEPWVHWVLYAIPPSEVALREAIPAKEVVGLAKGPAKQGKNSWGTLGYRGPQPPRGKPHRYVFKLYALDTDLKLRPGASKAELVLAMKGHELAESELIGRYSNGGAGSQP